MMGMASELYYEGIIKYGTRPPDFEALAAAVNYLRANDVMIEVGRAHVKGDDVLFPFVVKEPPSLFGDGTQKKSVSLLKQVLEECSVSYRKVVPSTKRTELLRVCTRLSGGKNAEVLADASDFKRVELPSNSGDPFARLVGMHEQKRQLRDIADTVAAYGREVLSSCHLSFTGDPGTGKTELARSVLAYFDALGVTSGKGVFVKADAADLIGRYVGNTPHLVREAVLRAKGGILFIDEAYRLASGDAGGNLYGREAVNTLVEMMESHRDEFVCVLAGYEREMGELFDMNPGLTDRVGFHIHFPRYSEEELASIFESFAERNQFLLAEGVREAVSSAARRLRELPDFANARTMRRLFERAVIKHCTSGADGRVLTVSDVEDAMADDDMGERKGVVRREVGFR